MVDLRHDWRSELVGGYVREAFDLVQLGHQHGRLIWQVQEVVIALNLGEHVGEKLEPRRGLGSDHGLNRVELEL